MVGTKDDDDGDAGDSEATDYKRLMEGTPEIAQFMLDSDGTIIEWPRGAQAVYGFDADDAIGHSLNFLYADGKDHPSLETLLTQAKRESISRQNWHKRADDHVFWASFIMSPLNNGSFHGYAVASQDTTTQKQYERMLERQNDRLKEFTDILSHDLQSPLTIIESRLELYRDTGDADHLDSIQETTARMERLVEDLLRVSRQGSVVQTPAPTDLKGLVETAAEGTAPASATVTYEPVSKIMADQDRLTEVFENLIRNSIDHSGPEVTVRVGPLQNGFYIEDNGPGIPAEDRETVFEHGFSTREDGTGYGLSVVRSIIGAHGWDIEVTAATDGGARFEITGIEFVSD